MAGTGSITIQVTVTNLPSGSKTVGPLTITSATASGNTIDYTLQAGANTINTPPNLYTVGTAPLPGGAVVTAAVIIPAAANTQTLTLKGVGGDTGIALSKTNPSVIPFDTTPPVSIIITAGGATSCEIVWV